MLTQIINGKILTPQGWLEEGSVLISDGKILEVTNSDLAVIGATVIDARGMTIVPGFVGMHLHGGGGHDFTEATEEAFRTALKMSDILKKEKWLSTQSTAWMLSTLSNFIVSGQTGIDAKAGKESIRTDKSFVSMPLTEETGVTNNGKESLYAVVSQRYNPAKGEETEAADNIRIAVRYTDMDGKAVDPKSIRASTDFYAVVTVSNISGYEKYTNLALTHIVPAGWEITSERDLTSVTYQDIRDDRVLSYFDLKRGESKEIPVKLTATYKGRYYLPSIYCEAMYDNSVRALKKGEWIEVVE